MSAAKKARVDAPPATAVAAKFILLSDADKVQCESWLKKNPVSGARLELRFGHDDDAVASCKHLLAALASSGRAPSAVISHVSEQDFDSTAAEVLKLLRLDVLEELHVPLAFNYKPDEVSEMVKLAVSSKKLKVFAVPEIESYNDVPTRTNMAVLRGVSEMVSHAGKGPCKVLLGMHFFEVSEDTAVKQGVADAMAKCIEVAVAPRELVFEFESEVDGVLDTVAHKELVKRFIQAAQAKGWSAQLEGHVLTVCGV